MSLYPDSITDPSLLELVTILELPEVKQASALNDFFVVRTVVMRRIAGAICRLHGRTNLDFFDEVYSIVMMNAMALVDKFRNDPSSMSKVRRYETKVKLLAMTRVVEWMATEAGGAAASGMTSALRRTRVARLTAESLAKNLGRTPTTEEVVIEANIRAAASRKDPARQGMVITAKDLKLPTVEPEDISDMIDITDPVGDDYDYVLSPGEGAGFVGMLKSVLGEMDEFTAAVGKLWLDQYGPGWGAMEPREIATRMSTPASKVSVQNVVVALETIKGRSVVMLSEKLNITAEKY